MATTLAPTEKEEKSDVSINWINYPDNLGVSPDLQHYMLFYINVRGKSKFNDSGKYQKSATPTDVTGKNKLNDAAQENASTIAKTSAGVVAGAATVAAMAGGVAIKRLGGAVKGGLVGGIALFGASKLAKLSDVIKPDQSYRISDVIALQVDERPSARYGARYDNKEVGTILGGLAGSTSAADSSTATGIATELALAGLMKVANAPGALFGGGGASPGDLMGLAAKATTNPFREVFFHAMDYRTFQFKYRFFPKNKSESEKVKKIIDTFKFHMHPELSANGLFYIYPSEFDIVYCYKGEENQYWHKISTCALTSLDVDYGGENFNSFQDGSPVEVNLSLTFQELEVLTKERMEKGY